MRTIIDGYKYFYPVVKLSNSCPINKKALYIKDFINYGAEEENPHIP